MPKLESLVMGCFKTKIKNALMKTLNEKLLTNTKGIGIILISTDTPIVSTHP